MSSKPPPVLGRYQGPQNAAPYPLSRMAPSFSLVDTAREIERADETIALITEGKLLMLAEQMRALQEQARTLLENAKRDAELHRARCAFEKVIGGTYHLYENDDHSKWFSLIGPTEWKTCKPTYVGSYRLEADMSFLPIDQLEARSAEVNSLKRLLGPKP